MTYEYKDGYLTIDTDREDRAIEDIAQYGFTNAYFIERLTITRAYIIACVEDVQSPDDTFSAKMKFYKAEFDKLLSDARASQATIESGTASSSYSIEIGRG